MKWEVIVKVMPFFDPPATQAEAAIEPKFRKHEFEAATFADAAMVAKVFLAGVQSHSKVWNADITQLNQLTFNGKSFVHKSANVGAAIEGATP